MLKCCVTYWDDDEFQITTYSDRNGMGRIRTTQVTTPHLVHLSAHKPRAQTVPFLAFICLVIRPAVCIKTHFGSWLFRFWMISILPMEPSTYCGWAPFSPQVRLSWLLYWGCFLNCPWSWRRSQPFPPLAVIAGMIHILKVFCHRPCRRAVVSDDQGGLVGGFF